MAVMAQVSDMPAATVLTSRHCVPSPLVSSQPAGQAQVNEPAPFSQVASSAQLSVPWAHSSISVQPT